MFRLTFVDHVNDGQPGSQRVIRLSRRVPQAGVDGVVPVLDPSLMQKRDEQRKVFCLVLGDLR